MPIEKTEESINFHANEFYGIVNWVQYNFVDKYLLVNYRLSDVVFMYGGVPRSEYRRFKTAMEKNSLDEVQKYIDYFKRKYTGEAL